MEFVQPIRDTKTIKIIKDLLKASSCRDYVLFTLGINTGLRISDLLSLKVSDVADRNRLKNRVSIRERKTGKIKDFPLGKTSKKALKEYFKVLSPAPGCYLFPSRKGYNKPISRVQAYRVLNKACRVAGLNERIGTHSMRKTFGYHAYKMGMDLSVIQKLLNHSNPAVTLNYIGITRDDLDNVYISLNL
jgi:integrase